MPETPSKPEPEPSTPMPTPSPELAYRPTTAAAGLGESVALERGLAGAPSTQTMIGDLLGLPGLAFAPAGSRVLSQQTGPLALSIRTFKMADDQSPRPLDRVYFDFNYFNDVNQAVNRHFGINLHNIGVYRETFGVEKTFFDQSASLSLVVPINSLTAGNTPAGVSGSSTDIGDLTVILKYALLDNRQTGCLLSTGLAITVPTGPDRFANSSAVLPLHNTYLQPYVGYIFNFDRCFVHGFTEVDVPTDSNDVTALYNDIGIGYELYRTQENQCLTAIVPTFELHLTTPLNHRGAFNPTDPNGTPDVLTLTFGTHFEIRQHAVFTLAVNTPVTGPRPYDFEVIGQLAIRCGASARGRGLVGN
jgi:hypothetical protein